MKISRIKVSNVLRIGQLEAELKANVAMFTGQNRAGKSSLAEAVRMAMAGVPSPRVSRKGEYSKLVRNGQKEGRIEIETTAGKCTLRLPIGRAKSDFPAGGLACALDAQYFSRMDADGRRNLMFRVMRVETDTAAIMKLALAGGGNETKVRHILTETTYSVGGFEAAVKYATKAAQEARGGWKAVTGETYGAVKAQTWAAPKPAVESSDELEKARGKLAEVVEKIESSQRAIGAAQERAKTYEEYGQKLASLHEALTKRPVARAEAKLEADKADLLNLEKAIAPLREKAAGTVAPKSYACPCCGESLQYSHVGDTLLKWEHSGKQPDKEALAQLPKIEAAIESAKRAIENSQRDVDASRSLQVQIDALLQAKPVDPPTAQAMADLKAGIELLRKNETSLRNAIGDAEKAAQEAAGADKRTAQAASLHADVAEWTRLAELFSPDGIPAQLLTSAIMPFNKWIGETCVKMGWETVGIGYDMEIVSLSLGSAAYALESASAKWLMDAIVAAGIAHFSGEKILLLDGFDILAGPWRKAFLTWIGRLVKGGDIEQVLLFGTLKERPSFGPAVDVFWLENGGLVDGR